MDQPVILRETTTPTPTDAEHPKLYEFAALGSGVIALACVIAIGLLAAFARQSDAFGAAITGLVSIGTLAINGIVQLLKPRTGG